jgi:coenzyme F420-0:L-glutamate ligase / coenzyme F420-1:gamma-L-glutamate ligase
LIDRISIGALPGIPLIQPGDDLTQIILNALLQADETLQPGDVLVIASKIVSKAEGRIIDLATVQPGEKALELAQVTRKDPRIVELVLQESVMVSRTAPGVLVTQHRLGFVSANAGIDQSNVSDDDQQILLLPEDPDASATHLYDALYAATGVRAGIVITDTHGRPFRMGNIGVAIGAAGLPMLVDLRGQADLFGRKLKISLQGYGDLIASAAHLVSGEGDEGRPITLIRGLNPTTTAGKATDLNRPPDQDLYR